MADLFNVTNENTIVDRTRIAAFGSNTAAAATLNPTIRENLAPRAFRLGLRYSF
jgi:hypothetical protein